MTDRRTFVKALHSRRDDKGRLYVACSECNRGGNGNDPDKCACGGRVKTGGKVGCFAGTLMPGLKV